jgi:enoyl-[acyl-carrier protein] reductase III
VTEKILAGKTALVTGGTRGIGRAISLKLASQGANVILNYVRDDEQAKLTSDEVEALGVTSWHLKADLSDLEAIHTLFEEVKSEAGGLDLLVNCAARGLQRPRPAMTSLPNHLRHTFDLNVLGPWFCCKEAAPLIEARGGGAVVNLTSLGAQRYMPNYAAVGVTKGALDTLTLYLAVELAPKGIRVNSVCPSWVEDTGGVMPLPQDYGDALRRAVPAHRPVTPEDVAGVVAFLCGPDSEMIIGQNIIIDGGVTLLGLISDADGFK